MTNKIVDINSLSDKQKVNYVKNLLFNSDLNDALDTLLKNEKKDLKIIKIIKEVLKEDLIINRIKQDSNLKDSNSLKLFVYSKILGILAFYNKTVILSNFLKSFTKEELKEIAIYEYQNKTNVSINNKTFNRYASKYKKEALDNLVPDQKRIKFFDYEKSRYNEMTKMKKKAKYRVIPTIIFFIALVLVLFIGYKLYGYKKDLSKYSGKIYPGIYLNGIDLSGVSLSELNKIVKKEKEEIENGSLVIKNINGENKFTYKEFGVVVDDTSIENEIISYNKDLNIIKKLIMINNPKKDKVFYLKGSFDDELIDSIMNTLKERLNVEPKNDSLVIDNKHNVYYDKGQSGFTLDYDATRKSIVKALSNLKGENIVDAKGKTIKNEIKYKELSSVNKKVASHTTYFANAGNRGHNINLASKRLNGTTLMPEDEFSYLKAVGPYGIQNGYLPAPVYINSEVATANGGGVCQLASTLYNAELKAGLLTTSRRGHTFAPNYVPRGLDATVYSNTTDFKFKNPYKYPVYIVSYVSGNYLTVDIWSNENALEGKTYEPYSVASNGGYLAYVRISENGKVIENKYLDRSVYKVHP